MGERLDDGWRTTTVRNAPGAPRTGRGGGRCMLRPRGSPGSGAVTAQELLPVPAPGPARERPHLARLTWPGTSCAPAVAPCWQPQRRVLVDLAARSVRTQPCREHCRPLRRLRWRCHPPSPHQPPSRHLTLAAVAVAAQVCRLLPHAPEQRLARLHRRVEPWRARLRWVPCPGCRGRISG